MGLIIAIVLLTVFFIIYTMFRRRAARRMAEMKAAKQVIESLKEEIENHRKGAEPNDDLTMMCIRVNWLIFVDVLLAVDGQAEAVEGYGDVAE